MCQNSCWGPFWAVVLVLAHISALSSPWYMWLSRANLHCDTRTLMTWSHVNVDVADGHRNLCNDVNLDSINWRELCRVVKSFGAGGDKCDPMLRTMDTTVAAVALSFVCSIVVIVYSFRRLCAQNRPGSGLANPSPVARGFMWAGFCCSLFGVVAFAAQYSHSWKKMFGDCDQWNDDTATLKSPSCPAHSLMGWNVYEDYSPNHGSVDGVKHKSDAPMPMVWVPVAFWAVVWICMCYLFALCTSHSQHRADDHAETQSRLAAQQTPSSDYSLQQPQQFAQQQPQLQPVMMQQIEGHRQPQHQSLYPNAVHI